MIRNCSKEYKWKRIPISAQKYKDGGVMDKSVVDLTFWMRNIKKGMKTTEVKDTDENFNVKFRCLNIDNNIFIHSYL